MSLKFVETGSPFGLYIESFTKPKAFKIEKGKGWMLKALELWSVSAFDATAIKVLKAFELSALLLLLPPLKAMVDKKSFSLNVIMGSVYKYFHK